MNPRQSFSRDSSADMITRAARKFRQVRLIVGECVHTDDAFFVNLESVLRGRSLVVFIVKK